MMLGGIEAHRAEHRGELRGVDLSAVVGVEDGELGLDLLEPLLADLLFDQPLELFTERGRGGRRGSALANQIKRGAFNNGRREGAGHAARRKGRGLTSVSLLLFLGVLPGLAPEEAAEAEAEHGRPTSGVPLGVSQLGATDDDEA